MPGSRRMRRSIQSTCRSFSIVAGLALTQQLVPAHSAIAQVSTVEERAAVAELMAGYHGEPGAVIAVVRGGQVAFAEGFGLASLEHSIPLGRETVLDIGSVAKQFTAFAIALLADEGTLSIDDDIRIHLPEVPDFGEVITIRHMIHHMSGLR
ncbi:MAG: serine hydrolase, partial [Gemmatimonadota bacterium]|nr:serine hydrolase [Gemmatimonadota bacterium]